MLKRLCYVVCCLLKLTILEKEPTAIVINDAANDDNETDKALYCISGGKLSEIMKVNKQHVNNKNFGVNQRARAKSVLQTERGFSITQT